jgi:hypothetical protein
VARGRGPGGQLLVEPIERGISHRPVGAGDRRPKGPRTARWRRAGGQPPAAGPRAGRRGRLVP